MTANLDEKEAFTSPAKCSSRITTIEQFWVHIIRYWLIAFIKNMLGVKEQTNDVKRCMVCDKTFHTAVTLKRHNREVHKLLPEEDVSFWAHRLNKSNYY